MASSRASSMALSLRAARLAFSSSRVVGGMGLSLAMGLLLAGRGIVDHAVVEGEVADLDVEALEPATDLFRRGTHGSRVTGARHLAPGNHASDGVGGVVAVLGGVAHGRGDEGGAVTIRELEQLLEVVAGALAALGLEAEVVVVGGLAEAQEGLLVQETAGRPVQELGLVLGQHRAAVPDVGALVDRGRLAVDEDRQVLAEQAHGGGLAGVAGRDAVAMGVDGDAEVGAHLAGEGAEGLVADARQGLEEGALAGQAVEGALAGRAVDADIGDLSEPAPGPRVEVVEIRELAALAQEEVVLDVVEGALDGGVLVGLVGGDEDDAEALGFGVRLEPRVEPDFARPHVAADGGHVVVGDDRRHRAYLGEGLFMHGDEGLELLVEGVAHDHVAREGQHEGEAVDDALLAFEFHGVGRPVPLGRVARRVDEAGGDLTLGLRADGAHETLEDGVAAGVAQGLDLVEHEGGCEVVIEDKAVNEGLVGVELAGHGRPRFALGGLLGPADDAPDGAAADAELPGGGFDAAGLAEGGQHEGAALGAPLAGKVGQGLLLLGQGEGRALLTASQAARQSRWAASAAWVILVAASSGSAPRPCAARRAARRAIWRRAGRAATRARAASPSRGSAGSSARRRARARAPWGWSRTDRKRTRLNSSHSS